MLRDFKKLRITLASPKQIMSWSFGEVKKAETINYRTQRAEVDGLMCERIFGPTVSFHCYCGKYKKVRYKGIVCDKCGVEVTHNRVRRERMGHIKLAVPVVHTWFSYGIPNRLSLILDIPKKKLEAVTYFTQYAVVEVDDKQRKVVMKNVEKKLKEEKKNNCENLEKETEQCKRELEEKISKLKTTNKETLAFQSFRRKYEKKRARLKELYMRQELVLKERFKEIKSFVRKLQVRDVVSEQQNSDIEEFGDKFFKVKMGAEAIETLLACFDLDNEVKNLRVSKEKSRSKVRTRRIMTRLRLLEGLDSAGIDPKWIVMKVIPVIPPALRPIIQLPGGRFATSDLNDLYRRVINRNNRLKRLMDLGAPEIILRNEKRMLQEATDALIDNSHRQGRTVFNSQGQPYKSLSDILRGKQGRFRQNLLGKRVDYSGRAVIVAGPELKLYECGLPKAMALEMFKPFVMREIVARGFASNIKGAKNYLEEQSGEVWDILEEVVKERPVLLNRAPTLHKQGLQAFFPILTEGNAIRIHPMVCRGFNADFDGDQMAVHVPLSKKAMEEAIDKMMPDSNMLLMADGSPVVSVNKDISLGLFLLTKLEDKKDSLIRSFADKREVLSDLDLDRIGVNEKIKVLIGGKVIETCAGRIIFNEAFPADYVFINKQVVQQEVGEIITQCFEKYGKRKVVGLLDHFKAIGFKYATLLGFSVSMDDFVSTNKRAVLLQGAEKRIEALNESYYNGLITTTEKRSLSEEVWMKVTEEIAGLTWEAYEARSNIVLLEKSGSYPVKSPIRQISAIRGLILDPLGHIVELPLRSNYSLGLPSLEYFVAARGSRKGLTDTALKTSMSGYLTRKMVDVAHDVITRTVDCGTKHGISLKSSDNRRLSFESRITGRWVVESVIDKETGEVLLKKGSEVTKAIAHKIVRAGIEEVFVRSPLTCEAGEGICCKCYGYNLGTKELVEKGVAVGIIAGQAMGEAATQLTLDSKHLAGRAGTDITQGLPRIEELFEVRVPKGVAILAEIDGQIELTTSLDGAVEKVKIVSKKKQEKEFRLNKGDKILRKRSGKIKKSGTLIKRKSGQVVRVPYDGSVTIGKRKIVLESENFIEVEYKIHLEEVLVKDKDKVKKGQPLTVGSAEPAKLMLLKGLECAEQYIIDNIQETYGLQGISIDDKHVEIVVRKLASLVIVGDAGDSNHLTGEYLDYYKVLKENQQIKKRGGKVIQFIRKLFGITAVAINTDSFLSAASFQEIVRVLSDAALVGKVDNLRGLKENVIIGRLVPLGECLG